MQSFGNSNRVLKDGEEKVPPEKGANASGKNGCGGNRKSRNRDCEENEDKCAANEGENGESNSSTDGSKLAGNDITVNKLVKTSDENVSGKNNNSIINNSGNNDNNNDVSRTTNPPNRSRSGYVAGNTRGDDDGMSRGSNASDGMAAIRPDAGYCAGLDCAERGEAEQGTSERESLDTGEGYLKPLMAAQGVQPEGYASPGSPQRANNNRNSNNSYANTSVPSSTHGKQPTELFKCDRHSNEGSTSAQAQFPKQQQKQKQAKQQKTQQKRPVTQQEQQQEQQQQQQNSNQAQQERHTLLAGKVGNGSQPRVSSGSTYQPDYPEVLEVAGASGSRLDFNTGYNNFNNADLRNANNAAAESSDCDEIDYNPNIINDSISNNVPLIANSSIEKLADGRPSLYGANNNKQPHQQQHTYSHLPLEPHASSDSASGLNQNRTDEVPTSLDLFQTPGPNNLPSNYHYPLPPAYSSCIIQTNPDFAGVCTSGVDPDLNRCFTDPITGVVYDPTSANLIDFSSLFNQSIMRKLNFIDESDNFEKLADFLVVPEGSNSSSICDKLFHEWGLETPKLIISVSGWACQMPVIPPRQHNRFKQGLLRIVQSTNTWILSSGITQGVDNLIAEVLQDAQYLEWIGQDDPQLHLIGLVNWNYIRNGDEIQFWASDPGSKHEAFNYNVNSGTDEYSTLNKLYSHFIFFDSASTVKDAEMRSALECYLSTSREPIVSDDVATDLTTPVLPPTSTIPTVLLVMGGELNVIEQVAKSLVNHVAVVICEGLGGASDIICRSLRVIRKSRKPLTPNQETNILNLIRALAKKFGTNIDEVNHTELEFIKIILEYSRYVIIYRIDRPNNHIDECILKALIRSVSDLGCDALQLAMNLHQCDDVVQSIVEAESDINNRKNIDDTCFRALIEGQLPFVKLFLEVGFEMKRYLTPMRLSTLYQHTIENSTPLLKLLEKTVGPKDIYNLDDVYFMVYYYTLGCPSKSLVDLPDSDNKGFEDPFRELCFWSLFSLKPELVNYFWSKAKNPLIIALMLVKLWEEIYNCLTIDEMDLKEEIEPLMEEYGELALKCLEEYQETNQDLNHFILMFRNPTFGYIDLIDVAGFTDNKDFIATSDAQICIENKWKSGMRCSLKGIIYSLFVPFSIPQIYSEKIELNFDADSNDNGLTLEEEILLLEEQNQKTYKMLKQIKEDEKLKEKSEKLGEVSSVYNGGKSLPKLGEEEQVPLMPTVIVKTKKGDKEGSSSGSLNFPEDPDVLIGQLDDTTGVSLKQTTYSQFYQAPVTKFFLHISMYFIFLLIYTYFYCYENAPGYLNSWKITIFVYMLSYVIEIIWHFCQGDIGFKVKLVIWCSSEWNLLDVTYLTFGIVAFFFSISQGWPMVFARALYGITSILMWIRLLRFYLASEKLGSMWIMIRRMLWETIIFMTHMGIMILASGISLYCINYRPPSDDDELFWSKGSSIGVGDTSKCPSIKSQIEIYNKPHWLFLKPYFMFNGELFLDKLKCGDNGSMAWVMAALVLLLGNALMLNLLVAIYAAIFNDVQENSEREWKMEMYWLLKDFEEKTILPPPLSLIETAVQLARVIHRKYNNYDHMRERHESVNQRDSGTVLNAQTTKRMQVFETYCVGKALRKMAGKKTSYDSVVDMIQDTEAQLGKVQDCKHMVNNVRKMIQTQRMRRRARRRVGNPVARNLPEDH